jgi:hypothetical protein
VFRYFVINNLALGLHVGGLFGSQKETSGDTETLNAKDTAFIGTIGADYYASLSRGMFLVPGASVGGFLGTNEVTTPAVGTLPQSTTRFGENGLAVRAGLGLSFYPSSHFKLSARPEALILIGSTKLKEAGGQTVSDAPSRGFTRIDAGFNVGMSYVF